LKSADEPNQYFNLPREARERYLALFHQYGVNYVFCGHYHRNLISHDGNLEVVTTSATGKPIGDKSGIQVVIVRDDTLEHHFYSFGEIPNRIELSGK
jgi:UDP-2,3-diacylglucosamine pyrophosphatase LpxH